MSRDTNVAIISGLVDNNPTVVTTRNNKRICLFNVLNVEKYRLADGRAAQHDNVLTVEALGRNVDKCLDEIFKGTRVHIHGYLRVDDVNGIEKVRIRAFHIEKE
jgi:single-stranded DNA-binding protein